MAKFATVGYGSQGQGMGKSGEGYTYVVNDNVRVGQRLQVVSTARDRKTKFVTTAVPKSTANENSIIGKQKKTELQGKGVDTDNLTKAYSGGELGAKGEISKKDVVIGGNKPQSEYTISARALAEQKYLKSDPTAQFSENAQETLKYYQGNEPKPRQNGGTFADYSRPFMKGEQ